MKAAFSRMIVITILLTLIIEFESFTQIPLAVVPLETGISEVEITSLEFVEGTDKLVYTTTSGDIHLYSVSDKSTKSWRASFGIEQLEISQNGKYIAVSGKSNIAIFNLESQEQLMIREDLDGAEIFHFDPQTSNILIYTADSKALMHHNIETGDRMQIKTVNPIIHLVYHSSGEFLVVGTKKETYSVNLKTGNTKSYYKQNQKGESNLDRLGLWDDHCWPLAFLDSGRYLVARPYGNFNSYLTIFESISGELESNFNVNYNTEIVQNLNPLKFSDPKSILLVPTQVGNTPAPERVAIKLFSFNKNYTGLTVNDFSIKKKQKGGTKIFYDVNSSGDYIATFSPGSESPKLELFRLKWE